MLLGHHASIFQQVPADLVFTVVWCGTATLMHWEEENKGSIVTFE